MSRQVSLPGRRHFDGQDTSTRVLYLMEFTHPNLDAPLRLSTDTTERLSTDPLFYGTRSGWRGADTETDHWRFVTASLEWPGSAEDVMPEVRLSLGLVHSSILDVLQSFTSGAVCNIAQVMSCRLDRPEEEHLGLELQTAEADLSNGGSVDLVLTYPAIDLETFPADRMTPRNFPGLYR
ncbi:hypothetical protein [Sagittula sp. S175]|uniref:hypothetical protein n=1 Tax=Sagittula sp. S175 TaxID=3415129 RepID=UPI003C7D87CC